MLKTDPARRYSCTEAIHHKWIQGSFHEKSLIHEDHYLEDAHITMRKRLEDKNKKRVKR
jgi:hypothetical protein